MVKHYRDRAYILNEEEPKSRGKLSWVWLPVLAIPFLAFGALAYFDNSSDTLKSPAGTYSTPSFEEGVGGGPGVGSNSDF